MSRTGRYKLLDTVFGILPFIANLLLTRLNENSGVFAQWFSIACSFSLSSQHSNTYTWQVPLGFGNAVVLQTTLSTLFPHIWLEDIAKLVQQLHYWFMWIVRWAWRCHRDIGLSVLSFRFGNGGGYRFRPALAWHWTSRWRGSPVSDFSIITRPGIV